METGAKIFNWITILGGIIAGIIVLALGTNVETNCYYCSTSHVGYPAWVWIIFVFAAIVAIILGLVINGLLNDGRYVAAGVLSILFGSLIGAIICFCSASPRYVFVEKEDHHTHHTIQTKNDDDETKYLAVEGKTYQTNKKIWTVIGPFEKGTDVIFRKRSGNECYVDIKKDNQQHNNIVVDIKDLNIPVEKPKTKKETGKSPEVLKLEAEADLKRANAMLFEVYEKLYKQGVLTKEEFIEKTKNL